ncbi:MAG: nucleotide exchange factor GrpE [Deltaproteobacteria bacterium]|nr:nucleotide exchange factor GrpE [Deltaproteobacteria bacterium]
MIRFNGWPAHARPNAPESFGLPRSFTPVAPLRKFEPVASPRLTQQPANDPATLSSPEPSEVRPVEVPPAAQADKVALRNALDELEAARARVERDAQRVKDETRASLIRELLPVLDNLDRTLRAASDAESGLVEGVRMIRSQLEEVLVSYGVERIRALGERFDPSLHEAIATTPAPPSQAGHVTTEVEAGYRFAGKVLRAAKVVVGALDSRG